MDIERMILNEIETAKAKYDVFNSTHEAYAVLKEEIEEFWELVKQKNKKGSDKSTEALEKKQQMIHELTQIAAIAQRAIDELKKDEIKWI
jgi:hypothetical protein